MGHTGPDPPIQDRGSNEDRAYFEGDPVLQNSVALEGARPSSTSSPNYYAAQKALSLNFTEPLAELIHSRAIFI